MAKVLLSGRVVHQASTKMVEERTPPVGAVSTDTLPPSAMDGLEIDQLAGLVPVQQAIERQEAAVVAAKARKDGLAAQAAPAPAAPEGSKPSKGKGAPQAQKPAEDPQARIARVVRYKGHPQVA